MRTRKNGKTAVMLLMLMCVGGLIGISAVITVQAKEKNAFIIDAQALPSGDETYDISLTIENQGADWEGTVRVLADENYRRPTAYDTALSLPQGSKKQFTVRMPASSIDSSGNITGAVTVSLLDQRGNEITNKQFKKLLTDSVEAVYLGILSDAYSKLTYLDLDGQTIYYYDSLYPIKLVQLQQGSLAEQLPQLSYLVIDEYNTGILTDEELRKIEDWSMDGGVLIIGTGTYAEETLSGFAGGYPGIECTEIYAPGEGEGYRDQYKADTYMDSSQLPLAVLSGTTGECNYYSGGWAEAYGDGSWCVLPYSLAEMRDHYVQTASVSLTDQATRILDYAGSICSARYASVTSGSNTDYYLIKMMELVGNNGNLEFGLLKGIVIVYVIFAGPVLYLILRVVKRRELYWITVPATAFVGIVFVFLSGRGFEVVGTRVYSVAVNNTADPDHNHTYLYCYDAGHEEWSLRLAQSCEYAGDLGYTYTYDVGEGEYGYHISKEGDALYMGYDPSSGFENSYFWLYNPAGSDQGSLTVDEDIVLRNRSHNTANGVYAHCPDTTVTNDTGKDMAYIAFIYQNTAYVYEGFAAGESARLQDKMLLYVQDFSNADYHTYIYDFLEDYYYDEQYDEMNALAALGVGIVDLLADEELADNGQSAAVIGVTKDWDKAVDDRCREVPYGCLYTIY